MWGTDVLHTSVAISHWSLSSKSLILSADPTQTNTVFALQLLYEACLCIWLLSYYDAAIDYLATTKILPRLVEVVKGSTKEKVEESARNPSHLLK